MQLPRLVAPWQSPWSTLVCVLHLGNAIFVCICFRWRACTWQRGADAWRPSRPWLNAKAQLQRDERKIRPHVKPHPHIRTHTHDTSHDHDVEPFTRTPTYTHTLRYLRSKPQLRSLTLTHVHYTLAHIYSYAHTFITQPWMYGALRTTVRWFLC